MITFKAPRPLNLSPQEMAELGERVAMQTGMETPLEISAMAKTLNGKIDPMQSGMGGEKFTVVIFGDGSFEVDSGPYITPSSNKVSQLSGVCHALYHFDKNDLSTVRGFMPRYTENEPAAIARCRKEGFWFAIGALLRKDKVAEIVLRGGTDTQIYDARGVSPRYAHVAQPIINKVRAQVATDLIKQAESVVEGMAL